MNRPPIIGVTPLWDSERKSLWMLPDYLDGIKAAGGVPVVLPIDISENGANRIIETCDGFLFTGGQDVGSCPKRDNPETLLLSKALQADKPILGICRGLQFLNVFLGGTLWQDLPSEHPSEIVHRQAKPYGIPTHKVTLSGELKSLLDKDILEVNTLHHQAIKDLADDLTPMAVAPDGIIEAVIMKNKRFVLAVQWHPEYMFTTDKNSLKTFECFINHTKTMR
ncbi:MAG: gamma-glutamyl-gamma-aminobutyrate hydrolase family protein [Bacteroidales bacterium]|nr:gamma-glutamyl-gamma-aminobutyrate hydrolase family protein [Bacteroidales bacterium]